MGLRAKYQQSASFFFITTSFYERKSLGRMNGVYEAIAESIRNRLGKTGAKLVGYVLMPSHIHLILNIEGGKLSDFVRDFKKFTSQHSLKEFQCDGKLWEDRYDRVGIWNDKIMRTKLEYIHNNPVKDKLVENAQDWKWSSASDYLIDKPGPLQVWKGWYL